MILALVVLAIVHVSTVLLSTYVAPFLSIVTALVTKADTNPAVKAVVNLALAAIAAQVVAGEQAGGLTLDRTFWIALGMTFVLSVASYYGLWKPVGVAGSKGVVARKTARFGLGRAR
jgi:hypothetical protein